MYCPQCGQERVSQETNFCSRCGYLLTGTAELLNLGGVIPSPVLTQGGSSPKSRGMKQGVFILLLTFLVVPLTAIFSIAINIKPWLVPIAAITLFVGGLLRIAYAALFESPMSGLPALGEPAITKAPSLIGHKHNQSALPPSNPQPASNFVPPATGKWRDTNELDPHSVTENTTRLLEADPK